jgi:glycosyltransferase involved in cell wall biosynthesis
MSVLLVNPMVAPQVQQTARALHEAGLLQRFVTTVRYDPSAWWQRAAIRLGRAAGYDMESNLRRRTLSEVPERLVADFPWWELARLSVSKLDRSGRAGDFAWGFSERAFSRAAARLARPPVSVVYSYEYCALAVFQAAKARGMRAVYEASAAEPTFVSNAIQREISRYPQIDTKYHRREAAQMAERTAWRRREWNSADMVIANSSFTRSTYAAAGLDVGKIRVVPLGAPPAVAPEAAAAGGSEPGGPLRLVWAGKFGALKGAHYLLEAWRDAGLSRIAELDVFGLQSLPPSMVNPPPEGIRFHGMVPRAKVLESFDRSDALVFPTLSDGFGMVATEAWSRGLPVITTRNAGASDLLRAGENGLLVEPGDAPSLAGAISWCASHRAELRGMRVAAQATASAWQWEDYRRALMAALVPVLAGPAAAQP